MFELFRRLALVGIGAGLIAGLVVTLLQGFTTVPLIIEAERYENAGGGHEHAAIERPLLVLATAEHEAAALPPAEPVELSRRFTTLLANLVAGVGFGLLLAGLASLRGRGLSAQAGVFWGIAGFATFALAPSLGLAPEVPGAMTAELAARQVWWLGTALATGVGLWLIVFGGRTALTVLAVVLMAAPHVIGSPAAGIHGGAVPPELAAEFVTASLVTQAVFWVVLGFAAGKLNERLERAAPSPAFA